MKGIISDLFVYRIFKVQCSYNNYVVFLLNS
jgi:hypothetical protein